MDYSEYDLDNQFLYAPIKKVKVPHQVYKTAFEKQKDKDFAYLQKNKDDIRVVHYIHQFNDVKEVVDSKVREFIDFKGEGVQRKEDEIDLEDPQTDPKNQKEK